MCAWLLALFPLTLPLLSFCRVESPGGYQLLGRTLTPFSVAGRYGGSGHEKHFLLRNFDVVAWLPMSEKDFDKVRSWPTL